MTATVLLHPGQHNGRVLALQRLLVHNRWGIKFYHGKLDGVYGPATVAAVREARYRVGYPKAECHNTSVGPGLFSYLMKLPKGKRLSVAMARRRVSRAVVHNVLPLRLRIYRMACRQLGYRESYGNRTKFGHWFGADGNPWCAYFVSWCSAMCGGTFHEGYTPNISALVGSKYTGTSNPKRGHGVTFDWSGAHSVSGTDHVGIFDRWINQRAGIFATVEGNTGDVSASNGGEVLRRTRYTNLVVRFFVIP